MSKNIVIQEGGIGKQLTVDKLKTNLVGGGSCFWVPEDSINLGTKHISENGTFQASDDGYLGYSEVTVSGVGSVTGKDPDGSGDDATATIDPETGDIVLEKIPSSIEVITPPTNPYGTYIDGQTITKDGMVVKGYMASGGLWGVVPNGEITLDPSTATYDPSGDITGEFSIDDSYLDHPEYFSQPIISVGTVESGKRGSAAEGGDQFVIDYSTENADYLVVLTYGNTNYFYAIGDSPETRLRVISYRRSDSLPDSYTEWRNELISPVTYTTRVSQSVVYVAHTTRPTAWELDRESNQVAGIDVIDLVTILYDGEGEKRPGSRQTINVLWPRQGDSKVLTDTFEILVAPGYGGDEGENGNAGTPPPGMLIP